jgi:hypothetical protein
MSIAQFGLEGMPVQTTVTCALNIINPQLLAGTVKQDVSQKNVERATRRHAGITAVFVIHIHRHQPRSIAFDDKIEFLELVPADDSILGLLGYLYVSDSHVPDYTRILENCKRQFDREPGGS